MPPPIRITPHRPNPFFPARSRRSTGVTLLELLVVITIMILMMALVTPAVSGLNGAAQFTNAINDVSGALEQARSWALANNTYVFVGFAEYDATIPDSSPSVSGTGRVVISTVASRDGTMGYDRIAGTGWVGGSTRLLQVGKPVRVDNIHLAQVSGTSGNMTRPLADCLLTSNTQSLVPFNYPLSPATARYSFTTVIQFSPQGSPQMVQSSNLSTIPKLIELGLFQTHGNQATKNLASAGAIQVDGLTGAVRTFRP